MSDSKLTYFAHALVILSSVAALILSSHVHEASAQKIKKKEGVQARSSSGAANKRVMVLNSYHPGYKWTGYLVEGIKQTLEDRIDNLKLYIEYMDTKRITSDEYLQKYYEVLRMKYTGVPLDLIIVSDDNAFQFLLRQHDELFGNTPVVFCGVNNFEESMIEGKDYITGVIQAPSIKETIDTALDLHPGVQQIVVLSDASRTGQAYQRSIKKVAEGYRGLEFVYLDGKNLTHDELFSRLSGLSRKSIVLLTIWLRDRTGNFLPMAEAVPAISSSSTAPVYGLIEVPLEHGMLGGKIQSGWYQGQKAAEIALQIMLEGKSPVDVPVVMESPNKYIFAYQQLQRWRIPERKLPEGSIILGKPRSLYEEHRHLIWSLLSILAFLMISVVVLATNNIKRRRAEKALKESEKKYRNITDNSSFGISTYDEAGNCVVANRALAEMIGATVEQVLAQNINTIQSWRKSGFLDAANEALESGEIKTKTVRLTTTFGKEVWLDCKFIRYYEGGEKHIMFIAEDIIERKKAEKERERLNVELAQKNRELEQIVYVTSHDLRSPLVSVEGFSGELGVSLEEIISVLDNEGLSSEIKERLAPLIKESWESIEYISKGILRMESLLNGLLQFSRSGRVEIKKEELDMNMLLSGILSSFKFQCKEKGVKVEMSELPLCQGDEKQINQLFTNLIGNAFKYCDPERPCILKISGHKENGQSVYCVEDNGIGIAPEYQEKIFEIFHQLNPGSGGDGLGLSIVNKIVERHNGRIWVESEPGRGSRFYVSL